MATPKEPQYPQYWHFDEILGHYVFLVNGRVLATVVPATTKRWKVISPIAELDYDNPHSQTVDTAKRKAEKSVKSWIVSAHKALSLKNRRKA